MKVFDFDNTIYNGECSLDFFMYCLKRKKSLMKYLPMVTAKALKYRTSKIGMDEVNEFVESMLVVFFDNCENLDMLVSDFWGINAKKLKPVILDKITSGDAIISASPRFLLSGIAKELGTSNLLCTEVDMKNKKISFLCYGENKVLAYREKFGRMEIDEFYTDNQNDAPLMAISKEVYLVSGNEITKHNLGNL